MPEDTDWVAEVLELNVPNVPSPAIAALAPTTAPVASTRERIDVRFMVVIPFAFVVSRPASC
ncbi:MAG: hypothetical protein ABSH36_04440 [Solirubrobacteraceae bacterium]